MDGIWDDGEWISWDEINDQLDEIELRENHIPPKINTTKDRNKSKKIILILRINRIILV